MLLILWVFSMSENILPPYRRDLNQAGVRLIDKHHRAFLFHNFSALIGSKNPFMFYDMLSLKDTRISSKANEHGTGLN